MNSPHYKKLNAPLYEQLKKYASELNRFHMPAHSGVQIDAFRNIANVANYNPCSKNSVGSFDENRVGRFDENRVGRFDENRKLSISYETENNIKAKVENDDRDTNRENSLFASAPFDITELSFSDNLNCPNGVIAEAESLMAKAYNSKASLFFTAGATSAIFTALGAIRTTTNKIALDFFSHKSIFSACRFFGFEITIIKRNFDSEGLPLPLSQSAILEAYSRTPDLGAIVVTSPDYFGNALVIEAISKTVHAKKSLLMVDEAHGAHFAFSSLLPTPAIRFADLVVDSSHKTLPVYTGGAVLNINCDLIAECRLYRANLHTSSPSYVTLASLDYARALFKSEGEARYIELKNELRKLKAEHSNYVFKDDGNSLHDFSRLVINVDIKELENLKVYADMSWGRWSVFICTPFNIDRLFALSTALSKLNPQSIVDDDFDLSGLDFPAKLLPQNANMKTEFIKLEDSLGRISAVDVGCYPPGTPILFAGEEISASKLYFLQQHKNSIFNLVRNKICVII